MKNRRRTLALLLSTMLLSGCAATPDSSIVRQIGERDYRKDRKSDRGTYSRNVLKGKKEKCGNRGEKPHRCRVSGWNGIKE